MFQPYYPRRHHGQFENLSHAQVLLQVQKYLKASENQPYLHPDAIYTERDGPTYARLTYESGLVLRQLQRVEAGLRGEVLAAESQHLASSHRAVDREHVKRDGATADAIFEAQNKLQARQSEGTVETQSVDDGAVRATTSMNDSRDWIDKSHNEQMLHQGEDGILEGEIGARSNIIDQEIPKPVRQRRLEEVTERKSQATDKDMRKRAKKARLKSEQKAREKQRQENR